jgi:hypothetical protein
MLRKAGGRAVGVVDKKVIVLKVVPTKVQHRD